MYFDIYSPPLNINLVAGTVQAIRNPINVFDSLKESTTQFSSVSDAGRFFNCSRVAIYNCIKNNKILFGRYRFELLKGK